MTLRSEWSAGMRLGWWAAPLVGVVVLVNLAGMWEIAAALRGLREHGERMLRLETAGRARTVETTVSGATADLSFLVASPALGFDTVSAAEARHDDIGGALLLFLRGHPQVSALVVRDPAGVPLLEVGRPRGVPGFWIPDPETAPLDEPGTPLRREFPIARAAGKPGTPTRLEASLDPAALVGTEAVGEGAERFDCALLDGAGRRLAGDERAAGAARAAEAIVEEPEWGAPGPWQVRCVRASLTPAAELEPLVARHRTTIVLNLVVMVLAVGLGTFAFQQQRRRRELEYRALQEARVRELERQLFHAERLGTVGRLAAGMAHEINNPLEGISNYLRLADDAIDAGEGARARRHLDRARLGVERAAEIVSRVLDHADPSAALHDAVDLGDVVARAVEFVRSRPEFEAIRFDVDLPPDAVRVRGNAVMLGQVFLNLVLNACEAQPEGGEVVVGFRRGGRFVDVEVSDRGPGVSPARQSRIFEPFESTKRSAGLGLSICNSIVERHGGELTFHEREGGGAIFRVRLGLAGEEAGGVA